MVGVLYQPIEPADSNFESYQSITDDDNLTIVKDQLVLYIGQLLG